MTIDLRIISISYSEPTLWVSVGGSAFVAILLGWRVGAWIARVEDPRRRRGYGTLLTAGALATFLVLAQVLLYLLFSVGTAGAMVCPAFVGPALLLPAILGVAAEAIAWRRTRASLAQ